jgi:repressor LexA
MNQLTHRQQAILTAIRQSMQDRGYPPTITELGSTVGLASKSSVAHQLRVLEFKGFISRDPGSARAIRVLDPQEAGNG